MSHDLFAAFNDPPVTQSSHHNVVESQARITSNPWETESLQIDGQDEDDDFGDFEDASATEPPKEESVVKPSARSNARPDFTKKPPAQLPPRAPKEVESAAPSKDSKVGKHPFADHMDFLFSGGDDEYDAGIDELNDLANNPEAAMAYSKRIIAEQMEREAVGSTSTKGLPFAPKPQQTAIPKVPETKPTAPARKPNKLQKKSGYAPAKDSSILFDIDNMSEEEKNDDDDDFGDFTEAVLKPATVPKASSKPAMPRIDLLGLNDPFSSDAGLDGLTSPRQRRAASVLGLPKDSRPSNLTTSTVAAEENDAWDDFETPEPTFPTPSTTTRTAHSPQRTSQDVNLVPPTTIPPPSVLLSLSPKVFAQITANPQTSMTHTHALAHILAGRKSRWKRDTILASSMRIGSAAGKGMKLTGVDRAEMAREEREVAECVRGWKGVVGKVRGKGSHVPELAETMVVRVLGVNEGGLKGNRACALCGLKREERVKGVDVDVDIFGEWWVEGVEMHVFCRHFWDRWSEELKSR